MRTFLRPSISYFTIVFLQRHKQKVDRSLLLNMDVNTGNEGTAAAFDKESLSANLGNLRETKHDFANACLSSQAACPRRILHECGEGKYLTSKMDANLSPERATKGPYASNSNIDKRPTAGMKQDIKTAIEAGQNEPGAPVPLTMSPKESPNRSQTSPPMPPVSSQSSPSPGWMPKSQQPRRETPPTNSIPYQRNTLSLFSKEKSNYALADESASMSDLSESDLEDTYDEISSLETEDPQGGIIAISVMTQPKESSLRFKASEEEERENISEIVAKDIAENEHNLKLKRKEAGTRRLPASCISGSISEAKRKVHLPLTNHVQHQQAVLRSVKDAPNNLIEGQSIPVESEHKNLIDNKGTLIAPLGITTHPRAQKSGTTNPGERRENSLAAGGVLGLQLDDGDANRASLVATPRSRTLESRDAVLFVGTNGVREKPCTASGAIGSSRAFSAKPNSRVVSPPVTISNRKLSASRPLGTRKVKAERNSQSLEAAPIPSSLHSTASVNSTNSGVELDEKTREAIARSSLLRAQTSRIRKNLTNEIRTERMITHSIASSRQSSRSMGSTSSTCSRSCAKFAYGHTNDVPPCVTVEPSRKVIAGRLYDGKQNCRTPSSALTSGRARRPCNEKEACSQNTGAPFAGAHSGLQVASAEYNSQARVEQENLSFHHITMQTVNQENLSADEAQDLEVQAGLPVVLPGAFAIGSRDDMEQPTGYDSAFEEDCQSESVRENPEELISTFCPEAPETPVEAELYEEHYATVQLVQEEANEFEKVGSPGAREFQAFLGFFALCVIAGVTLVVTMVGGKNQISTVESNIPKIEGWSQVGSVLMGPTDTDIIEFGYAISMSADGSRIAIGLPGFGEKDQRSMGSVFIMDYKGTEWLKTHQIDGPGIDAEAGKALALSQDGKRVAISAPSWENSRGQVQVYEDNQNGKWSLVANTLTGEKVNGSMFGSSLGFSADGNILAVGDKLAHSNKGVPNVGSVHVFEVFENKWTQMGDGIFGQIEGNIFGWSLSLSGDGKRFAASALGADGLAGSVHTFDYEAGIQSWLQVGSATLDGETERENFGASVTLASDGATLAVGSNGYTASGKGIGVGRVTIYGFDEGMLEWSPIGEPIEGSARFDSFGTSVALSKTGNIVAIGGPENDDFGIGSGHVQVMEFDGSKWNIIGSDLGQSGIDGGQFGFSVALSANASRVACAAPFTIFDGFRNDIGQVLVYDVIEELSIPK